MLNTSVNSFHVFIAPSSRAGRSHAVFVLILVTYKYMSESQIYKNFLFIQTISFIIIRPSLRRDVLWYTNVRLYVRPFHMSRSNLRTPWTIHFKFHRVIGIDGLTLWSYCILYGEIRIFIPELWDFIHQIVGDFSYVTL
jgi:hypothetical protein